MDEDQKKIFSHSEELIQKLKLLSLFFEEELIFKIYIRTEVIHKLFRSNPELDVYKLDLFHVQFTQTIIELLNKVRNNNEKMIVQVSDEIQVNEELIKNLTGSMHLEESFSKAKEAQTAL